MAAPLPAGFTVTSINGKRCTAVPRGVFNTSSSLVISSAQAATSVVQIAVAAASQTVGTPSITPDTTTSPVTPPPLSPASDAQFSLTPSSTTAITDASATAITIPSSILSLDGGLEQTQAAVSATPPPALALTANIEPSTAIASPNAVYTSSTTPQAEVAIRPTNADSSNTSGVRAPSTLLSTASPTAFLIPAAASSPGDGAALNTTKTGVVVGSAIGGVALMAAIGFFLWWCTRKRRPRSSFITPLTIPDFKGQEKYFEFDNGSLGPTSRSREIRTQAVRRFKGFVAATKNLSVKAKDKMSLRSSTPSVNLNRGNSQFLESIPQHSRSNSAQSTKSAVVTTRDRLKDWWSQMTADANHNSALHQNSHNRNDQLSAAREKAEQDGQLSVNATLPDFLRTKESELHQAADPRRRSQSMSVTGQIRPDSELGTFGTDFTKSFAGYYGSVEAALPRLVSNGPTNQTRDPITVLRQQPSKPMLSALSEYEANAQHSRALSASSAQRISSRYPSTIRLSRDSNRDTVFSNFSYNVRKGKGRSDPFDLERPEFRIPPLPAVNQSQGSTAQASRYFEGAATISHQAGGAVDSTQNEPPGVSVASAPPRAPSRSSYTSQYSRATLDEYSSDWGDPGPDLRFTTTRAGEIRPIERNYYDGIIEDVGRAL